MQVNLNNIQSFVKCTEIAMKILAMAEKEEHGVVCQYMKRQPDLEQMFAELIEIRKEFRRQEREDK